MPFACSLPSFLMLLGLQGSCTTPEQVHLSLGNTQTDIVVTWVTFQPAESLVRLRAGDEASSLITGASTPFKDGGITASVRYIHRVLLTGLKPGERYSYECGDGETWTGVHNFIAPNPKAANPKFIIFGDLGIDNAQALPLLRNDVSSSPPDAVIHIGDIAYEMQELEGTRGDKFMTMIEPVAASTPYMVQVGNHEHMFNFSHYKERFSMPGDSQNYFYSWNYGSIHFVAISTEVYFFDVIGGSLPISNQLKWLVKDLQKANTDEERQKRPWIIVYGHRPMYCSGVVCPGLSAITGIGGGDEKKVVRDAFEELFYQHGVDIQIWGHWHLYERTWPMYKFKVHNGSFEQPYTNSEAPIHIVTGAPGMYDKTNCFKKVPEEWSASRSSEYSYTKFNVTNATTLYFEQVAITEEGSSEGKIVDSFYITKTNPRNFP